MSSTSPTRTSTKTAVQPTASKPIIVATKSKSGVQAGTSQSRRSVFQSRTVLSSASRRNTNLGVEKNAAVVYKPPVVVFDEAGKDVTPLPLLQLEGGPGQVRGKHSHLLDSSVATPSDLLSQGGSMFQATTNASAFGGGPFTKSAVGSSQSDTDPSGPDDIPAETSAEPDTEITRVIYKEPTQEKLTEIDLEKTIDLELEETGTIWLLDLPGTCVSLENEEAEDVKKQNHAYQHLLKNRIGNDRYVERGMCTFNNPMKMKLVQTNKIGHSDVGVMANYWDMYDTYKLQEQLMTKVSDDEMIGDVAPKSVVSEDGSGDKEAAPTGVGGAKVGLESRDTAHSSLTSVMGEVSLVVASNMVQEETQAKKDQEILQSEELKSHLVIMERILSLNLYQSKQCLYRGFNIVQDVDAVVEETKEEELSATAKIQSKREKEKALMISQSLESVDMTPYLDRLWEYKCPLTKGHNVSCIAWNKMNTDLLAVGYGQFEYSKQKEGLICCWSIKNPEWPERTYVTDCGITSLDFSTRNPSLLAAGMHNGTIAIYNVGNTSNEPILDSLKDGRVAFAGQTGEEEDASGKHTGPVWQLEWVEKERGSAGEEKTEVLVSISTDGRVTQWSIRKGFESQDLMKLKREATKTSQGKTKKPEALISKHAGGFSFDFLTADTNIYLAGTEEGLIHKCSCSYNEQYLDSYSGHTGPVYKIQWSPFSNDTFLSCSGDWSVRLWHQDRSSPVLNFVSTTKSIQDVCWSPHSSLVFASVNEGAVEVWDLGQNVLDPTTSARSPREGVQLSCVSFALNTNCVLVGDSDGAVAVLQLKCMSPAPVNQADALQKVIKSCLASQLKK